MFTASRATILLLAAALGPASAFAKTATAKPTGLENLKLVEGDEQGNDNKSLKSELLITETEKKAVAQLQKLIKKYKGGALEPDLQFRLAELYMRRSKSDRFFEIHRDSETVVRLAPALVKDATAKLSVKQAVDTYALIQSKFAEYSQMDLVIYNHAFARQLLGDEKVAETLYWDLISKYPTSPLVPDAHLAIGEISFVKGQFANALTHFNAIKNFPESRVFPYGLYKAAWTYYNMRDAEKGLKKLEETVAYGRFVAQNNIESRLDLRKEALNDMTLFYEDVYPSKDAYTYFREQAGELEVGPILLRMASLYDRHSRFLDQRVVLEKFVKELPTSPLIAKVNRDLVLADDHLHKKDDAVARLEEFSKICPADSKWIKATTKTPEAAKAAAKECLESLNETALYLGKKWLKAWKKLPSDTTYADSSEKAFRIYLRTPSDSDDYAKSHYAYADLLFARGKFRDASTEYASISHSSKSASVSHDASYGAVISLEKAVGEKWSNEDEKSFHQLAAEYVAKNPKGQYRLDVEYKMALLAYEKERYAEAGPVFLRLGREFPKQEKGQKSQDLYLDILNIKKDYVGIRDYAQELMKAQPDAARGEKMRKLYEQAYFLEVQGHEEKGQLKEALTGYITFAQQNPKSEFASKAMWNIMLLQYKLNDSLAGAKSAEAFAMAYPTDPQSVNALLRAAQTFEQMAQLSQAARVLDQLAIRDASSTRRWKELAADFHAMDGEANKARQSYNDLKVEASPTERVALLQKLEALEKNYGTDDAHAVALKQLIDQNVQPQANNARVEAVEAQLAQGHNTEAFNEARHHLGGSMTANQKARLRMVQAKVLEQEFTKQSVKSRADRVATVLAIKTEKLQKVQEALQSAIKYGDPKVSVDAFERLYSCYSSYVKSLKEMPTPSGLSAADAQAFRGEIDKLVIPLEEKSVDTLAQAVNFARKQQFLDGTTARLEAELDKINQTSNVNLAPPVEKPEMFLPLIAKVSR